MGVFAHPWTYICKTHSFQLYFRCNEWRDFDVRPINHNFEIWVPYCTGKLFPCGDTLGKRCQWDKTVIIDQDNVFTKMLSVYPNNFVMFLEQFPEYSIYRTNVPLELIPTSDSYRVCLNRRDYKCKKKQNLDNLISLRPSSAFSFILLLVRVSVVRLRVLKSYFLHVT